MSRVPWEKSDPLLSRFCHRRHPTLDLATMVGTRLLFLRLFVVDIS